MRHRIESHVPPVIVFLLISVLVIAGCGHIDAPTASQPTTEGNMNLWNPQPGDHVFPGDQIPMLRPGYWESEWGMAINPAQIPVMNREIGPEGGVIRLGRHSLTVPSGAVESNVNFSLTIASMNAIAIDCGPSGSTFSIPVTLEFSYNGTQYDRMDNPDLSIYYAAPDGSYQRLASTVDPVDNTVSADLNHFSRYILTGEP